MAEDDGGRTQLIGRNSPLAQAVAFMFIASQMSLSKDKVAILNAIATDARINPLVHLGHPPHGMHESRIVAATQLTIDELYTATTSETNSHSGLICELEREGWIGLTSGSDVDRFGYAWLTRDGRIIASSTDEDYLPSEGSDGHEPYDVSRS
jgi:hypothetical protein